MAKKKNPDVDLRMALEESRREVQALEEHCEEIGEKAERAMVQRDELRLLVRELFARKGGGK